MINISIYLSAGLSVLIAFWVIAATYKFIGSAFKINPETEDKATK